MAIVEFENASYSYDGSSKALDHVTAHIGQGEFVCVLGGNGSGKSTFAKHVNALLVPDEGRVSVFGRSTSDASQVLFIRANAGMVFQNPDDQIVASTVEEDVAFGPENLGLSTNEVRERVSEALGEVGLQHFESRNVATLSGGQKQRVSIAGALAMKPQILILDEASAMLDPRGRSELRRICRKLNEAGLAIILITHFMDEAVDADRVIVLDAGRAILEGTPDEVFTRFETLESLHLDVPFAVKMSRALQQKGIPFAIEARMSALESSIRNLLEDKEAPYDPAHTDLPSQNDLAINTMGSSISDQLAHGDEAKSRRYETPLAKPVVLEFKSVSYSYQSKPSTRKSAGKAKERTGRSPKASEAQWALRGVSFALHEGECLGIAGHTGSGKSTLVQLANGLLQPTEGCVLAYGNDLSNKRNASAARREIGVVFQYPERQLFAATVFDDVAFGPRNLGLSPIDVEARVSRALDLVRLPYADLRDKSPFSLSGGQQRRVALAGVLAMDPRILVLDEPTAGLDPRSHSSLMRLIVEFRHVREMTIVLVSHNMDDLAKACDRILILNQGLVFVDDVPSNVFANESALAEIGLGVPSAMHLANSLNLRPHGDAVTINTLADLIASITSSE